MRKFIGSLLVLSCILVVSSCSEDTTTSDITSYTIKDIFPLNVGSKWEYRSTWFLQTGDTQDVLSYDYTIDSLVTYRGMPAYQSSAANGMQFYYYKDNNAYTELAGFIGNPFLVRYPMEENEVYVIKDTVYSNGYHSKYTFRRLPEKRVLPSTDGDPLPLLKYELIYENGYPESFDTIDVTYKYFARGIGLVEEELYDHRGAATPYLANKTELLTYRK